MPTSRKTDDSNKNAIIFEIQRVFFLPHKHIFDEELIEGWKKSDRIDHCNIYFITVAKKYRFDLKRTSTNILGELKTYVRIGENPAQRVITHVHRCNSTLYHALHDKSFFGEVGFDFKVDRAASNEKELTINVKTHPSLEPVPLVLLVENVLQAADCQLGIDGAPRIVYIGQSFRVFERLRSHSRINQTSASLRDDEELHINLVRFKIGYVGDYMGEGWKFFLHEKPRGSAVAKEKVSLLERTLIAFFRPELNDQHVETKLHKDSLVSGIVDRYDIDSISVGVGVHGPLGKFWSPRQSVTDEVATYSFVNPSSGFRSGIDIPALGHLAEKPLGTKKTEGNSPKKART
ncbi:hypothetical protein FGO68_gene7727 [Halteria grandinella]|uniref:Uncharacterized protein n=1 Tax=Halteria grandinella TaxID=5974 RepID=A0A8J8SUM8_HALGN|nr:hypothetical protein FGO68_gene7727 [Halteria grandinella]